jgi:hypothetical protein
MAIVALAGCGESSQPGRGQSAVGDGLPRAATTQPLSDLDLQRQIRWVIAQRDQCHSRMIALVETAGKRLEESPLPRRDRLQCFVELTEAQSLFETEIQLERLLECYRIDLSYAVSRRDDPRFTGGYCGTGAAMQESVHNCQDVFVKAFSDEVAKLNSDQFTDNDRFMGEDFFTKEFRQFDDSLEQAARSIEQ